VGGVRFGRVRKMGEVYPEPGFVMETFSTRAGKSYSPDAN
jgi:hypothetical protein